MRLFGVTLSSRCWQGILVTVISPALGHSTLGYREIVVGSKDMGGI